MNTKYLKTVLARVAPPGARNLQDVVRFLPGIVTRSNSEIEVTVEADHEFSGAYLLTDLRRLSKLTSGADIKEDVRGLRAGSVTLPRIGSPDSLFWRPKDAYTHVGALDAADLSAALGFTRHAAASRDARGYLNGVHIRAEDGVARVEATDGHRLAQTRIPARGVWEVILPRGAVPTIMRAPLGVIHIDQHCGRPHEIQMRGEGWMARVLGIDARYPDTGRVFPPDTAPNIGTISGAELIDSPVYGKHRDLWGATYDPRYLADAGKAFGAKALITARREDGNTALELRADGPRKALIMPMRVES